MSGIFKKIAAFVAAFTKKYWGIVAGAGMYHISSWIYDNPLWMIAELKWKEAGVLGMMVGAFLINTALLIYFRNKNTKFILWSALDELSEKQSKFNGAYDVWMKKRTLWRLFLLIVTYIPVKVVVFLLWCLEKSPRLGDLAAFLLLPIVEDPFITTMYLRHGHQNGLRVRDCIVYMASSIISIGYWAARNAAIVELIFRPILKI